MADDWFTRDGIISHYRKPEHYRTFLDTVGGVYVRQVVAEILKQRPAANALEIGPGLNPLIHGFKQRTYMDLHDDLLQHLDGNRITGDISTDTIPQHDVIVLSEVLTHIRPEARAAVASKLADAARIHLLIVDAAHEPMFGSSVDEKELEAVLEAKGFKCELKYVCNVPIARGSFGNKDPRDYFILKAKRSFRRGQARRR